MSLTSVLMHLFLHEISPANQACCDDERVSRNRHDDSEQFIEQLCLFFSMLNVTFISVSPERLPPSTRHTMTSAKPRLVSSRLWSHQKIHEQWSGRQPLMFYRVTAAAVTAVAAVTATAVSPEQDPSEHEGDLLRSRPPVSRSYHLLCLSTRDTNTHANTILILFVVVCGSGEPGQIPCKR